MAPTLEEVTARLTGVLYGTFFSFAGVGVFVVFVGVPIDLLPPVLARPVLNVAPWLVTAGNAQPAGTDLLLVLLLSTGMAFFGLWILGSALFDSGGSVTVGGGTGGGE